MSARIISSTSSPHYIHHSSIYFSRLTLTQLRKEKTWLKPGEQFRILNSESSFHLIFGILLFSLFYNLSTAESTTLNIFLIYNHC